MYKIFGTFLIMLFLISIPLSAQSDIKIRKRDFREDKAGFKEAWEHVSSGDGFYKMGGVYYNAAFNHYIKALAYNNSNPELNYKTGIAAIYTDHKEEAAGFFLKALELKRDVTADILLYTGRALQYSGRYDDAIDKLTSYLKSEEKKTEGDVILAERFIEECSSALIITSDSLNVEIVNLGANINSENDDFSPVLSYDGETIYFASGRRYKNSPPRAGGIRPDENIYVSRMSNGSWGVASPAGNNLLTDYNEAPLYIDSAGTSLFIYAGSENGGDIKVSVIRKGDWKSPESIPYGINSLESETSIAFHPSGEEIYFVTNGGKDNLGGYDICFITRISEKKWSKPRNAGDGINTTYDEQSVSISRYGDTLWFSSKGHNSIGGFDIFYSVRNADGTWGKTTNAGYPLNTPWDELFYNTSLSSGAVFYFASNRSGGFGGFDIYRGRIMSGPTFADTMVEPEAKHTRPESPE
jgi:tetratricopeptide (TPR) repeat protein